MTIYNEQNVTHVSEAQDGDTIQRLTINGN